ncbi:PepSY domain-containing protein [Sphingobium fuliginis]|uniref:PepSY domain-containing protein n=1 Tax=Sphingobium fuliginis ATCC 27551 TaxID=1208342 RepID=A0A5B8CC56_SPHSA|nr:PepSY domain-containing protein [Sphingobium fuliginis]QDC37098.1 PepSY domain-containing protein [Sphingobium fuliginis ATCC 27551]
MGLLDGGLASIFNAAFSGLYLDASLHTGTGTPIYGPGGVITGYSGGDRAVKVQVDAATDAMRRGDGYAEGDVRIIILAQGIGAVTSDHRLTVGAVTYSLQSAELDAAASHWICRGRRI